MSNTKRLPSAKPSAHERRQRTLQQQPAPTGTPAHTVPKSKTATVDVLRFMERSQRTLVVNGAERLLAEVESFVTRLKGGGTPHGSFDLGAVSRVVTDHAKLLGLLEAIEIAEQNSDEEKS